MLETVLNRILHNPVSRWSIRMWLKMQWMPINCVISLYIEGRSQHFTGKCLELQEFHEIRKERRMSKVEFFSSFLSLCIVCKLFCSILYLSWNEQRMERKCWWLLCTLLQKEVKFEFPAQNTMPFDKMVMYLVAEAKIRIIFLGNHTVDYWKNLFLVKFS